MKIIFMGTPQFSVKPLEALASKYEVVLVVSQPSVYDRKKKVLKDPPVVEKAKELGIDVFQPESIKNEAEYFKNIKADMIVTSAYGQFIPTKILNLYSKCINIHGSLLPYHRGGAPIQRAIIEGDKTTGVTIMEMVRQMDAGRMYAKVETDILDTDNNSSLFERLSDLGTKVLMDNIEDIYSGKNEGIPQDETLVTISPNISPEEERIDFNKSNKDVFNLIRGLSFEPGAYAMFNDIRVKIYESKMVEDNSNLLPGTIISLNKEMKVKCLVGAISILKLQVPGKKMMNIKDFLNGQKLFNVNDKFD